MTSSQAEQAPKSPRARMPSSEGGRTKRHLWLAKQWTSTFGVGRGFASHAPSHGSLPARRLRLLRRVPPIRGARSLAFGRPNSKCRGSTMNSQPNANSQPSTSTFPIVPLPAQPPIAPACCPTRRTPAPPVSSAVYQGRCDDVPGAVRFFLPRRLRVF
jgi:hypothetical protein